MQFIIYVHVRVQHCFFYSKHFNIGCCLKYVCSLILEHGDTLVIVSEIGETGSLCFLVFSMFFSVKIIIYSSSQTGLC